MVTAGIVRYDPVGRTHVLPLEHAAVNDASLIDVILPLVDGLPDRLVTGIDVARWDTAGQFDAVTAFDTISTRCPWSIG